MSPFHAGPKLNKTTIKVLSIALYIIVVVLVTFVWSGIMWAPQQGQAAVNKYLNYQGKLLDSSSNPVSDGSYSITFKIYNVATGGASLWSDTFAVSTQSGLFSILLGSSSSLDLNFEDESAYYLGVTVESDSEMTPRKQIGAAAYAFNSDLLDGLDKTTSGSTSSAIIALDANGNLTITGNPQGGVVTQGSLYINPASGDVADEDTLFGVAVGGTQKLLLDEDGDLTLAGFVSTTQLFIDNIDIQSSASRTTSGAYLVGVDPTNISSSASTNVQFVLEDISTGLDTVSSSANIWKDGGTYIYPARAGSSWKIEDTGYTTIYGNLAVASSTLDNNIGLNMGKSWNSFGMIDSKYGVKVVATSTADVSMGWVSLYGVNAQAAYRGNEFTDGIMTLVDLYGGYFNAVMEHSAGTIANVYGVYGVASEGGNIGMNAYATNTVGVYGTSQSSQSINNYGGMFVAEYGDSSYGVYGESLGNSTGIYGVYGKTPSGQGYPGYFTGGYGVWVGENLYVGQFEAIDDDYIFFNSSSGDVFLVWDDASDGDLGLAGVDRFEFTHGLAVNGYVSATDLTLQKGGVWMDLEGHPSRTTSGAYLVGVDPTNISSSASTNVQFVLEDISTGLDTVSSSANIWKDGGTYIYPARAGSSWKIEDTGYTTIYGNLAVASSTLDNDSALSVSKAWDDFTLFIPQQGILVTVTSTATVSDSFLQLYGVNSTGTFSGDDITGFSLVDIFGGYFNARADHASGTVDNLYGVYGNAVMWDPGVNAAVTNSYGVYGRSGTNIATHNYGGYFSAEYGESAYGIYATADNASAVAAVYGESNMGYPGYFKGGQGVWIGEEVYLGQTWGDDNDYVFFNSSSGDVFLVWDDEDELSGDVNLTGVGRFELTDPLAVNGYVSATDLTLQKGGVWMDLEGHPSRTTSGAYLVGVDPTNISSSASTNVQFVLEDLDAAIEWTDGGTYIYPTDAGDYGGTGMRISDDGAILTDADLLVDGFTTTTGLYSSRQVSTGGRGIYSEITGLGSNTGLLYAMYGHVAGAIYSPNKTAFGGYFSAAATASTTIGVYGEVSGVGTLANYGIYGSATGTNSVGVYGIGNTSGLYGKLGTDSTVYGRIAYETGGGNKYGEYIRCGTDTTAESFQCADIRAASTIEAYGLWVESNVYGGTGTAVGAKIGAVGWGNQTGDVIGLQVSAAGVSYAVDQTSYGGKFSASTVASTTIGVYGSATGGNSRWGGYFNETNTGRSIGASDDIYLGQASSTDDDYIYFDAGAESIAWLEATTEFYFTDSLDIEGDVELDATQAATTNGLCHSGANSDDTFADRYIVACSGGPGDIAEWYETTSDVEAGDIVAMADDTVTFDSPDVDALTGILPGTVSTNVIAKLEKSSKPYQTNLIGVISTSPAESWGRAVIDVSANPNPMAVGGRAPVKVVTENGDIGIGDPITASSVRGAGMKATKPGKIIGYALNSYTNTNSTEVAKIMVYVNTGWHSGNTIDNDGNLSTFKDNFAFEPTGTATSSAPAFDSYGLSFRGSGWNSTSATAEVLAMTILNSVSSTLEGEYGLQIENNEGTAVAYVSKEGDLMFSGRLYPSNKGVIQRDKYIFLDKNETFGDYMRTNADGWATGSYDYAEMFPSEQELVSGELVTTANVDQHVKRSSRAYEVGIVGIVSTKPGFIAGEFTTSTYPIALSGRVPARVTNSNGTISIGDPITTSDIPGLGMKASSGGPIVGYALESTDAAFDTIIVYINPGWYGGEGGFVLPGTNNDASEFNPSDPEEITYLDNDLVMNGNSIFEVSAIYGYQYKWEIDSEGQLRTNVNTSEGGKDIYGVMSTGAQIVLSGSATLETGQARLEFSRAVKEIISHITPVQVTVTPTSAECNGIFVSDKSWEGFTVQELAGGASNATFDWVVVAQRAGYEVETGGDAVITIIDEVTESGTSDQGDGSSTTDEIIDSGTDSDTSSTDEIVDGENSSGTDIII